MHWIVGLAGVLTEGIGLEVAQQAGVASAYIKHLLPKDLRAHVHEGASLGSVEGSLTAPLDKGLRNSIASCEMHMGVEMLAVRLSATSRMQALEYKVLRCAACSTPH